MRKVFGIICFCFLSLLSISCGGGGGDDSGSSASSVANEGRASGQLSSLCGVVSNSKIVNPAKDSELVSAKAITADSVLIVKSNGKQQAVKLHGVTEQGVASLTRQFGKNLINSTLSGGAYFVKAGSGCNTNLAGGRAAVFGQLFSLSGENISELLLQNGAVKPAAEACKGDILSECYSAIGEIPRQPSDTELQLVGVNFSSSCGAVRNNRLFNPVTRAERVTATAISSDSVIITRTQGVEAGKQQFVKLQSVASAGVPSGLSQVGINLINQRMAGGGYAVIADQNCTALVAGGKGVFGQLYDANGRSINEALLSMGAVFPFADTCGGEKLTSCYQNIPVSPSSGNAPIAGGSTIDWFLWKPVSESNGNLVVLVNPVGIDVRVNGQSLRNHGPSNDRGTTARASAPGCSFGNNVRVEFFKNGNRVLVGNGSSSITVPRGCDRFEKRY